MGIYGVERHTLVIGNMNLPFNENRISENVYIRTFTNDIDIDDLVWHRDAEDRIIKPLNKTDWLIQIDNELPKLIISEIFIPKGVYHRLIKGSDDLKIQLTKLL